VAENNEESRRRVMAKKKDKESKIQAIEKWLVVQPVAVSKQEKSKIIIPDGVEPPKEDADFAVIISVGNDCDKNLEKGQIVLLLLGSCLTMPEVNGKSYLACRSDRVVSIVDNIDAEV